jgi:hypothetical protein
VWQASRLVGLMSEGTKTRQQNMLLIVIVKRES